MEGAVATQDGELEHGRDFSLVKGKRTFQTSSRRGWRDDGSFAPGKRALQGENGNSFSEPREDADDHSHPS